MTHENDSSGDRHKYRFWSERLNFPLKSKAEEEIKYFTRKTD